MWKQLNESDLRQYIADSDSESETDGVEKREKGGRKSEKVKSLRQLLLGDDDGEGGDDSDSRSEVDEGEDDDRASADSGEGSGSEVDQGEGEGKVADDDFFTYDNNDDDDEEEEGESTDKREKGGKNTKLTKSKLSSSSASSSTDGNLEMSYVPVGDEAEERAMAEMVSEAATHFYLCLYVCISNLHYMVYNTVIMHRIPYT